MQKRIGSCSKDMLSDVVQSRRLFAITLAGALLAPVYGQTNLMLQDGTPVRMKLGRNVSSASAVEGETVDFEVLDEIKIGEIVVIPQGSKALATVTDAKSRKSMGRAGRLNVSLDYVRAASGEKVQLRGIQDEKAGGHVGAITGAMVATSVVFFPAAPLFLFIKGKDITIPKGHEVTAYVNSDFKIDPAKFQPSPGPSASGNSPSARTGKPLTNEDILSLKAAGFSDELLISKIKGSPGAFTLETNDLLMLKKAGLSDAVIGAMVNAGVR